jgi:indole-3-glycerol phosphate synthase
MNLLEKIFTDKQRIISVTKARIPLEELESGLSGLPEPPPFSSALRNKNNNAPRLIAEIKRRSPTRGTFLNLNDPGKLAKIYCKNGAAAISILTDQKYFGGTLKDLDRVRKLNPSVPILRKDFIFDRYQILEARLAGASAVLLIAAALQAPELELLIEAASEFGLTALVEVHQERELETALAAHAQVIGVNNRNLEDFSVDLGTSLKLRKLIPSDCISVSESGIRTEADVGILREAGFDAILVGESLMTASDIAKKTRELAGLAPVDLIGVNP